MRRMAVGAPAGRAFESGSHRDPVCGMAVEAGEETTTLDGLTLRFCSSQCRATFARAPERYLGAAGAQAPGAGATAG